MIAILNVIPSDNARMHDFLHVFHSFSTDSTFSIIS